MQFVTGILHDATRGLAIDHTKDSLHNRLSGDSDQDQQDHPIHTKLDDLVTLLHSVHTLVAQASKPTAHGIILSLTPGYSVQLPITGDYPYNMLFCGTALNVEFSIVGIGKIGATLQPGWNDINLPPETRIMLASGSTANASLLYREGKDTFTTLPQFTGLTQAGYIPLVTPPAQTNANADTPLTFAMPVNTVTIQNNTLANAYYAFDALASLGSLVLYPGTTLIEPKRVTAPHLFTVAAQNINGTSGNNIVVLGEL
jgi:hypothetical protein